MADPFVAEIRIFPFNFAPKGWAWCDGQILPLSQNTALFSLLGTTYGGDGKSNFALARPAGPRAHASRARALDSRSTISARRAEQRPSRSSSPRSRRTLTLSRRPVGKATCRWARRATGLARYPQAYQTNTTANLVAMAPEALAPAGGDACRTTT